MKQKRGTRRRLIGTVVSNRMDKSVVIQVERLVKHKLYQKYVRQRSKFSAHDKNNECQVGDKVSITESRPLSKTKKWQVTQVIERAV